MQSGKTVTVVKRYRKVSGVNHKEHKERRGKMNRKSTMILAFVFVIAFAFGVQAQVEDPIGVVKRR